MRNSSVLARKRVVLSHYTQRIALVVITKQLTYVDLAHCVIVKSFRGFTISRVNEQPRGECVKGTLSRPVLQRLPRNTCVLRLVFRYRRALAITPEVWDDCRIGVALYVLSKPVDTVF